MKAENKSPASAQALNASRAWMPNIVFGFILSGIMSLVISGISTARAIGMEAIIADPGHYVGTWITAYIPSWAIAFPVVIFVAPIVRKLVTSWFAPSPLPGR